MGVPLLGIYTTIFLYVDTSVLLENSLLVKLLQNLIHLQRPIVGTMQGELKPMEYESESEEEDEEELSTGGSAAEQRYEKIYYHNIIIDKCGPLIFAKAFVIKSVYC